MCNKKRWDGSSKGWGQRGGTWRECGCGGEQKQTAQGEMFISSGCVGFNGLGGPEGFAIKSGRVGWSGEELEVGDGSDEWDHEGGRRQGWRETEGGRRRRGTEGLGGRVLFVVGTLWRACFGDFDKTFGDVVGLGGQQLGHPEEKVFPGTRE